MKMKVVFVILALVSGILFLVWGGVRISKGFGIEFDCYSYLKRAADANTIEMAKPQLDKAIKYLEDHNLTTGIVSIFLKNPANDIDYFYQNLVASRNELEQVKPDASQLEKSNVLIKLRETLLDTGIVTHPCGLAIYPNNRGFMWWAIITFILTIVFGCCPYFVDD